MRHIAQELGDGPQTRRITAIAAGGFSITTQLPSECHVAWRNVGEQLLRLLDARGAGAVITVDEMHRLLRALRFWHGSSAHSRE